MLQRRLLVQLHTYVCLMAAPHEEEARPQEEDLPLAARVGGRSFSTPNALSFGSPSKKAPRTSFWQWGRGARRHMGTLSDRVRSHGYTHTHTQSHVQSHALVCNPHTQVLTHSTLLPSQCKNCLLRASVQGPHAAPQGEVLHVLG